VRVAIAGGNGFVGRELTGQLVSAGHEVVWLSHRVGRVKPPEGVREVSFDPGSTSAEWTSEIAEADGVVNLSGYPIARRWTAKRKRLLCASRIDTTKALAEQIARVRQTAENPAVFVSASAVGIYGNAVERMLDEGAPLGDDFLATLAVDWEDATCAARESGCRVVTIRNGVVLGARGVLPRMKLASLLFLGGPVGSGQQWVSWIHIRDLAGLYRFALEDDAVRGALNGGAPYPVRMNGLSRAVGKAVHRPSWLRVSGLPLEIALGEVAPYTVMSQRMSAEKALDAGYTFAFANVDDALADLLGKKAGAKSEAARETAPEQPVPEQAATTDQAAPESS
jgi:uncharacterized protein (TIGR01777 family)